MFLSNAGLFLSAKKKKKKSLNSFERKRFLTKKIDKTLTSAPTPQEISRKSPNNSSGTVTNETQIIDLMT